MSAHFLSMHRPAHTGRVEILGCVPCDPVLRSIPIYMDRISAGFPSPADDYVESALDLNQLMVKNPAATFMVRVSGDSMIEAGIHNKDILVVDRSTEAAHGHIVIAVLDGELTVKRLYLKNGECQLRPENASYAPIRVHAEQDLHIWGVVTGVVRRL